jgi:pyruvate formate-lyase activating enzyme-like uncharacterized protein
MRKLKAAGIKGWPQRMTLFTRSLPMGCRPCLRGQGSNLVMTLECNRDCFFCFNPKPRVAGMSVHGRSVRTLKEGVELIASLGVESVGISGGEPLLEKRRVLALARALRRRFGRSLRIDLYTNGDLLSVAVLRSLKAAGVSGLRMNLAANGYDPASAALALGIFRDVEVEIPMIPDDKGRVLALLGQLEELGCRQLILHELFVSAANAARLEGRRARERRAGLTWSGVAGSEEAALEVLLAALRAKRRISVYYCSTGTQGWIAEMVRPRLTSSQFPA